MSDGTPLDSERERLRKQGYTDAEVSQILVTRAAGGRAEATGHAPMTGVGGNLAAGAAYAKNFVPGMAANLATASDRNAAPAARSTASISLVAGIIVVLVVGYVVWLELSQLRSGTERASAEACQARLAVIVKSSPVILPDRPPPPSAEKWKKIREEYNRDCGGG